MSARKANSLVLKPVLSIKVKKMGVRAETLMAMADRIARLENTLKVFAMERLFETAIRLGKEKEALEVVKIFEEIHFDEGPRDMDDLREALQKMELASQPALAKMQKSFMRMYLEYVLPTR